MCYFVVCNILSGCGLCIDNGTLYLGLATELCCIMQPHKQFYADSHNTVFGWSIIEFVYCCFNKTTSV